MSDHPITMAAYVLSDGRRVGFTVCPLCGSLVLVDELERHAGWHHALDELAKGKT